MCIYAVSLINFETLTDEQKEKLKQELLRRQQALQALLKDLEQQGVQALLNDLNQVLRTVEQKSRP